MYKVVLSVLYLALVYTVEAGVWPKSCPEASSHDVIYGSRLHNDSVIYETQIVKKGEALRKHSYDVVIPPRGQRMYGRINSIEVYDQYRNGNGGCVYLKSGGIGLNEFVLHVKSKRGGGINFVVTVYGQ